MLLCWSWWKIDSIRL